MISGCVAALVFALCACGGSDTAAPDVDMTSTPSVSTASQGGRAQTSASSQEEQTLSPALGLTMTISGGAASEGPTTFSDGRRQVIYHVDTEAPYSVFVEYYPNGEKTAADILAIEKEAFSSQGAEVMVAATDVEGGSNAQRLDWTQKGETVWSTSAPTASTDITGMAVVVDGQGGYAYAVYVLAPSDSGEAVEAARTVLDSVAVSTP